MSRPTSEIPPNNFNKNVVFSDQQIRRLQDDELYFDANQKWDDFFFTQAFSSSDVKSKNHRDG